MQIQRYNTQPNPNSDDHAEALPTEYFHAPNSEQLEVASIPVINPAVAAYVQDVRTERQLNKNLTLGRIICVPLGGVAIGLAWMTMRESIDPGTAKVFAEMYGQYQPAAFAGQLGLAALSAIGCNWGVSFLSRTRDNLNAVKSRIQLNLSQIEKLILSR